MSEIAIKVDNLSKVYQIGKARNNSLIESIKSSFDFRTEVKTEEFYALNDLSFEINKGDVIGIVGKNGAGKSTLLKILSRITSPTRGRIEINGRVASLLEVGTGFHPELTGRENIYLNGTILGMTRTEIKTKFDEIVDFSGVEKFIDTPVKHYSSGMYVRLAFSVAAHLEPEILIIDEVLAVGDTEFQKKCLGKMEDVSKSQNKTILFVSHNMSALKALCKKGLLLRNGTLADAGSIEHVINNYLSKEAKNILEQHWPDESIAPGNEYVKVKSIKITPQLNDPLQEIITETPFKIFFEFWNYIPDSKINLSLHLSSISGELIFASGSPIVECDRGLFKFTCEIPGNLLNEGIYSITMMIVKNSSPLFILNDGVVFEVHDVSQRPGGWFGKWPGIIRPKLNWITEI